MAWFESVSSRHCASFSQYSRSPGGRLCGNAQCDRTRNARRFRAECCKFSRPLIVSIASARLRSHNGARDADPLPSAPPPNAL